MANMKEKFDRLGECCRTILSQKKWHHHVLDLECFLSLTQCDENGNDLKCPFCNGKNKLRVGTFQSTFTSFS